MSQPSTSHYELVDCAGRTVGALKHGTAVDAERFGRDLMRVGVNVGTISVALVTERVERTVQRVTKLR